MTHGGESDVVGLGPVVYLWFFFKKDIGGLSVEREGNMVFSLGSREVTD